MKIKTKEFTANFHSLSGITVGERRKNLFLLLNQTSQDDTSELDFSAIQPRTPLEEKFKVETLLYFKRVPDLIELLKSENPIFITRALKSSISKEFFQNITADELVTLIFPYVSFSTKEKILNKLCFLLNDSQRADELYLAVENKYGSYLAFKLLPSCSLNLIMSHVRSNRVLLTPRQVEVVISKHPSATEELLSIIDTNFHSENYDLHVEDVYKKVFIGVSKCDINLFAKLHQKYNFSFHLGWRLTDRLVRANQKDIIEKPDIYRKFLKTKQIAKTLHQNFKNYYMNLFPKTIEMFKDSRQEIFSTLKHLPAKMKNLSLYLSCFEAVYGHELWNHPEFVTKEVLDMLSSEEREQRIKVEYKPVDMPEEIWNSYLKTEKSIPFLTKKIHLTSDNGRKMELVELLIKTCKINEDREGLLNICKFMLARCGKDQIFILHNFLRKLRESFKLENLEKQHWICINKLVQNCVAKGSKNFYFRFHDRCEFEQSYIHYRLINKLSVKEQLINCIKEHNSFSIMKESPQYEKRCLLIFCEIVPEMYKGNDNESYWKLDLFSAVVDWNKRYQDDQMSLLSFTDIFDSIKKNLDKGYGKMKTIARYFVSMEMDANRKATFLDLYLSVNAHIDLEIIHLLLLREPQIIAQYIDNIIQNLLGTSYSYKKDYYKNDFFWKTSKNYSHLKIPQQIVNICLKKFNDQAKYNGDSDVVKNAIVALSHLMPTTEFLKLIMPYYPSDLQADSKTAEGRKMYQLQESICTCLKNLIPPSEALETILIFCKGDYLKIVRQPLYSASSKTNEDKLPPFFSAISDRAVSVRKHAIHLAFRVLDKKCIGSVLTQFMESDKNVSMHKFIFKCAFNFFKKSPDNYTWELVMLSMKAVDVEDEEAFAILMDVNKIPEKYLAKYVPFTWDIVSKLSDKESEKTKLLNLISPSVIQLLPKEFCEIIINNYLLKSEDGLTYFQSTVQSFTCKYIIYCNSQTAQEERLKTNFAKLRDYITATWYKPNSREVGRNCASSFVEEFCKEFLSNGCSDKEILMKFADLWNRFMKPHEALDEYLHLQLTLIHIENLILSKIAQKVSALCDAVVRMYGPIVVGLLSDKINYFAKFLLRDQDHYDLVKSIVVENSTVSCLLLAISLLNKEASILPEAKAKYNAIVEILEGKPDPIVQLHLQTHFSGITSV